MPKNSVLLVYSFIPTLPMMVLSLKKMGTFRKSLRLFARKMDPNACPQVSSWPCS